MKCEENAELLIDYSLGQLDPDQMQQVREHVEGGCGMCADRLNEIAETWASLAASLDPVPPSADVEEKLLAMIRGQIAPPIAVVNFRGPAKPSSREQPRILRYVLAATLAGVASAAIAWQFTPVGSILAGRNDHDLPPGLLGIPQPNRSNVGFQTVALKLIAEKSGVQLSVVMIPQSKEWHVFGTGLPPTNTNEVFQIWLESKSGAFQKAAVLPVKSSGRGGVVIDMGDIELADLSGLWLTSESLPESSRPSDNVLFRASIQ